jgi:lipoprotein-anchoring transpeptidase ErfK/SrfK
VVGTFNIYIKLAATTMEGEDYYLPNVPYTMFFYKDYGIHGTYWHNNFGHPMSHGCVNVSTPAAAWLFGWASVGTPVVTHN